MRAVLSLLVVALAPFAPFAGVGPISASSGSVARAEHLLLTSDLRLLRGTVAAIGPTSVLYRDAAGQDVFLPAEQCLGFVDLSYRPPGRHDPGMLLLADGQRIPGRPELRQGRLVWVNPLLGTVRLDLEHMKGLSLRAGREPPEAGERDVVLLANGDRVEGVIESIGTEIALAQGPGQEQSPAAVAGTVNIPLERVDAVGLVTPLRNAQGCRVWLEDGTVADVERPIAEGDGQVHLRGFLEAAETRAHGLPLDYLRGIRFSPTGFTPLALLPPATVSAPPERLFAPTPEVSLTGAPLGLSPIRLSGPLEARWSLPEGMRRIAATVSVPDELRAWADLELVVLDGQGERQRLRVTGESPRQALDATLRDGTLILRLEEGRRGPIGDTIVLETPVLGSALAR